MGHHHHAAVLPGLQGSSRVSNEAGGGAHPAITLASDGFTGGSNSGVTCHAVPCQALPYTRWGGMTLSSPAFHLDGGALWMLVEPPEALRTRPALAHDQQGIVGGLVN